MADQFAVDKDLDSDDDADDHSEGGLLSEDVVKTVKTALAILGIDPKPTPATFKQTAFASLFRTLIVLRCCNLQIFRRYFSSV